jgi:hypothetical protein
VIIDKILLASITNEASTNSPFTLPARVALAKPEPIDLAISKTLTLCSNWNNVVELDR